MTLFSPVKLAIAALALSAWAANATAATPIYIRAGSEFTLSGAPDIVESHAAATGRAVVFLTQGLNFARTGVLTQDLDLITPDPDHHLPAGTQLFARERPTTGTNWCTVGKSERHKICLYQENGAWIWQQNDTRLPARCLFILPCVLGPPKIDPILHLPVNAPAIEPLAPADPPQFVARITIKPFFNNGFQVKSDCETPPGKPDSKTLAVECYRTMYVAKTELSDGLICVGGDNTGAMLRYNTEDDTITVTKVALDPATGKITP
jgi:hypothetical protein